MGAAKIWQSAVSAANGLVVALANTRPIATTRLPSDFYPTVPADDLNVGEVETYLLPITNATGQYVMLLSRRSR